MKKFESLNSDLFKKSSLTENEMYNILGGGEPSIAESAGDCMIDTDNNSCDWTKQEGDCDPTGTNPPGNTAAGGSGGSSTTSPG